MKLKKLIKKTLLSIVLATALLTTKNATATPEIKQPQTYQEYSQLFDQACKERVYQKKQNLDDFEDMQLFERYSTDFYHVYPQVPNFNPDLSENEQKRMIFFAGEIAVDGLKKVTDQINWTRKLKQEVSKTANYEVYVKGKKKQEKGYSPTLEEQKRLEQEKKDNTTRINILPRISFDSEIRSGINTFLDEDYQPAGEAYLKIENPSFGKINFRKIELGLDSHLRARATTQTEPNEQNQYYELQAKTNPNTLTFSAVKEIKNPRARLEISTGYGNLYNSLMPYELRDPTNRSDLFIGTQLKMRF